MTASSFHERLFACVFAWVKSGDIKVIQYAFPTQFFGVGSLNHHILLIQVNHLVSTPIIQFTFQALATPELFDVATDLICEAMAWSSKQRHSDPATVAALVSRVLPLSSWISEAVRDENTDRVRGLARMFAEAGEAYVDMIVRDFTSFKGTIFRMLNERIMPH